jgi:hypothetical protein
MVPSGQPRITTKQPRPAPFPSSQVTTAPDLALGARSRLAEAVIGLAVPGRPLRAPCLRRTRAPMASATGRDPTPLGPRWVRGTTVAHGHQRSLTVAHGSEEPQVIARAAHAAGITQRGGSDCGSEGRGSSPLRYPTAARGTRHRDAAEVAVRVAESSRAQPAQWTSPAVVSGHVAGSGPSTLKTVAPTPPTRTRAPAPQFGRSDHLEATSSLLHPSGLKLQ